MSSAVRGPRHGRDLCDEGDAGRGSLWLARALTVLSSSVAGGQATIEADRRIGAPDPELAIRANLGAWQSSFRRLKGVLPHQGPVNQVAYSPDGKTVLTTSWGTSARLWDAATGKAIGAPLLHEGMVYAIAYSPDGNTVVTGSQDKTARLWDAATAKPIGATLQHLGPVYAVAFSPDGKTVLTGSEDKMTRLWDAATGKPIRSPIRHHDAVRRVAYSPDGKTVLAVTGDTARLWDATTGQPIGSPLAPPESVSAIAYSPDGKTVLTGSNDKTARLWDAATGQPIGAPLEHQDSVYALAYSPDGKMVLTGSGDKTARLWDAATGNPIGEPLQHEYPVFAVAFGPDGKTVLTGSDKMVRLWDVATRKPIGAPLPHRSFVHAVACSPDGRTVLTGGGSGGPNARTFSELGEARLWEVATGVPIGVSLGQDDSSIVGYSPDGKTILTRGSHDLKTAQLWDTATRKPIGAPLRHQGLLCTWAFSPDSKRVLTGSVDKTARLWDARTAKPIVASLQHQGMVRAVAYAPDGKTVLTASDDKTARLWDPATGKPIGEPLKHEGPVYEVAYSPDGKTIFTKDEKTSRLWDAATRKPIGAPLQDVARAGAFSPDGKTLLTGSQDQTARLWDVATAKPLGAVLRHRECLYGLAFSPDGKTVLTGSADHTARLWDAATGKPTSAPLWHQGPVFAVAYSPDGKTVLAGSLDHTARLWNAATARPIGAPLEHQDGVWAVAYSPDGKTALTGSWDKTVRLWDTATGRSIGPPLQHRGPVNAVLWSPAGKTILAASQDAEARVWQPPVPMEGPADRINLSMEVATGLRLAEGGAYQNLSAEEWLDGRRRLEAPGPLAPPDPSVAAPRGSEVTYMPDTGDLSLTPAAMPDLDSAQTAGVAIPGGQGDLVVVTDSDVNGRGGRVARKSADGGTKWVTPLDGYLSTHREPQVVVSADRAYVAQYVNREAGVTALDVRTGQVLWRSPGPAHRLLLSGDVLLAADCSIGTDEKGGGRFFLARRAASGTEAFRVPLPAYDAANHFDALPIEEVAGWFVVQTLDGVGGVGSCFLVDRAGQVRHRLDRQVLAVRAAGEDRLVLTSHDVIRLGADGPPRWTARFAHSEWIAGGGLVPLEGGEVVAYLYCQIADSGVEVLRLDPRTGRKRWEVDCHGLGVEHSKYSHHAVVEVRGERLTVTSRGSGGTFVEALSAKTGRSVGRRIIDHCQ
jgi:WD40 repeat protein